MVAPSRGIGRVCCGVDTVLEEEKLGHDDEICDRFSVLGGFEACVYVAVVEGFHFR